MNDPRYVIANIATGEIVRTATCSDSQVEAQAQVGEITIQSDAAERETHYVSGGALIAYTEAQRADKAVRPPHESAWSNTAMAWIDPRTLAGAQAAALVRIDDAAGAARLRYITDVPGQQAVYLRKMEQAQAFAAGGYVGDPPPYVASEAQATGATAQVAADTILAVAAYWDGVLSPAIEEARIGGKRNVESAATVAAVDAATQAAVDALAAI